MVYFHLFTNSSSLSDHILIGVIPAQLKQGCTPYVMDFFLIKYTCRYH